MNSSGEHPHINAEDWRARALAAEQELRKWHNWRPDDNDLAAIKEQAQNSGQAGLVIYVGHLEAHHRRLTAERDAARVMELAARKVVDDAAQHIVGAEEGRRQALEENARLEAERDQLRALLEEVLSAREWIPDEMDDTLGRIDAVLYGKEQP